MSAAARSPAFWICSTLRRYAGGQVLAEEQLAVAQDDAEQVVEVVGHPAGQPSHRLHLLALAELLLGVVPLLHLRAELGVAALDLGQHLVEGRGQDAQLVSAGTGHAHRVVLALGHRARRRPPGAGSDRRPGAATAPR